MKVINMEEKIKEETYELPYGSYVLFVLALSFFSVGLMLGVTLPNKENLLVAGVFLCWVSLILAIYGFFKYKLIGGENR